jgi:hypothetical protein
MADPRPHKLDPGTRLILEELRDLRLEMRAERRRADAERRQDRRRTDAERRQDRLEDRRRAAEERQRAAEERQRAAEERQRAAEERQRAAQDRRRFDEERKRSDERFDRMMRESEHNSARREAATQRAFRDIRAVGLSIVRTLNHHTGILQRIEKKLPAGGNGRPWHEDGSGPHPRR